MILGISGKLQSGKDSVVKIWKLLDIYNNILQSPNKDGLAKHNITNDVNFVKHYLEKESLDDFLTGNTNINSITKWEKRLFARKLKEVVALITGCKLSDLENNEFKSSKLPEEWAVTKLIKEDRTYKLMNIDEYVDKHYYNGEMFLSMMGYTSIIEKYIPTYREMLQVIGTDCFRNLVNPNTWVISTLSDYKEGDYWLISDVRFPNEVKGIKDKGGLIIRINRPGMNGGSHESEVALDDYNGFDYIIENDGTIEDLIIKVKNIMKELKFLSENA